jgi:protease-4
MMLRRWFPLLVLATLPGCVHLDLGSLGGRGELVEEVVFGEKGPKILMLEIDGIISGEEQGSAFGLGVEESLVARVRSQLDLAAEDDDIRAVLVRINSPGGTVTASDIIHRELLEFKKSRSVPVVAQLMGLAASGGYYVAMAADRVLAHPTTVTGSIGVIFSGLNLTGLLEKVGVENQTLTSGAFKDTGSALRPMRDDERAQLQSVLDDFQARFRGVVDAGRPGLDAEAVARLADGRIFSAEQALAAGLVDGIAYLPEAVKEVERRAGLEASRVVVYRRPNEWAENLYSAGEPVSQPRLSFDWLPFARAFGRPGFLYLWYPAAAW